MAHSSRALSFAALALAAFSQIACGTGFDPGSELKSLRVLGVQKSIPYPQPGDDVTLSMLWHDGRSAQEGQPVPGRLDNSNPSQRNVQVMWFPPCLNPAGDLYQTCFADPRLFLSEGVPPLTDRAAYMRDRFTFQVPAGDKVFQGREPLPGQPKYGLFYVFFALCAGTLELQSDSPLPRCVLDTGESLEPDADGLGGSKEFVIGYSTVYVFATKDGQEFSNENPTFAAPKFRIGGREYEPDCMDPLPAELPAGSTLSSCITPEGGQLPLPNLSDDEPCDEDRVACVKPCEADGEPGDCPAISIGPALDRDVVEREKDTVSAAYFNRPNFNEQMWINYYTDHGGLKSEVRLLNDATEGFNPKYRTDFYAPKAGPSTLWAVVHDNRGGQAFMRKTILVKPDAP
ncbi:MAG TPA: hypothetical protein VFQ61_31520 [Polyangiaceae bacterium]|nr:hypothetical protein [Polyangiaceae bacterium]